MVLEGIKVMALHTGGRRDIPASRSTSSFATRRSKRGRGLHSALRMVTVMVSKVTVMVLESNGSHVTEQH
jgi:hypothetical protein